MSEEICINVDNSTETSADNLAAQRKKRKKSFSSWRKFRPIRLAKRDVSSFAYKLFVRAFAIGLAWLIIMLFAQGVTGFDFATIWTYMKDGAFAESYSVNTWLKDAAMLLMISLALAPVFKMKFWNIGAQGQVLMGALLSSTIMFFCANSMGYSANIFVMLLLGILAGGIWALIPAFFKVKFGANETLFTLMMNYVAIQLVACCINKWKGNATALGIFNMDTHAGYMADMFGNPIGAVVFIAAILVFAMYVYMNKTKHGYEISVVGDSPNTARYAGMSNAKIIMRTVFLSGAICGLVGMLYISAVTHNLSTTIGGNYGFTAIIVAWTAKFNPVVMVLTALAIAFLERGSVGITDHSPDLNSYTAYIIVAIFLILLIGCEFFINYKIIYNEKITAAFQKFHDKLEAKVPWLTKFCHAIVFGISNLNKKTEEFFSKTTATVKIFAGKVADSICERIATSIRRVKLKLKTRKCNAINKDTAAVNEFPDCNDASENSMFAKDKRSETHEEEGSND